MRLKSPASRLFTQPFIQAQIKANIKAPRHWPLWGEFTGELPSQMSSNAENVSIWWRHHGYKTLPAHTVKPSNTTRKVADDMLNLNPPFDIAKKMQLLLNKGVRMF